MRRNIEIHEDYNFARCRYCKFPLDKSRDRTAARCGIVYSTLDPAPTADDAPKDFVINAGCPKCGTPQPY